MLHEDELYAAWSNAVRQMPLDKILLETDAPYLTPAPLRKGRNDSSNIELTIDFLSELLDLDKENYKDSNSAIKC